MSPIIALRLFVLVQATVVWLASDRFEVPLFALIVTGLASLPDWAESRGRRSRAVVLTLFAASLLVASTSRSVASASDERGLLHLVAQFAAESLLLVQSLAIASLPIGTRWWRWLPSLGLLTILGAFHQTIEVSERSTFLVLSSLAVMGFGLVCQLTYVPARRSRLDAGMMRNQAIIGILAALLPLSWGVAWTWEQTVRRSHDLLPSWLAIAVGHASAARGYVRSGSLHSITAAQQSDPTRVALRVYADRPPGYLRGRVFDVYRDSQWRLSTQRRGKWNRLEEKDVRQAMTSVPRGLPLPQNDQHLFAVEPLVRGPLVAMEIHNDPARDEMYFVPLTTGFVCGTGSYLAIDEHRAIHGGIDSTVPYLAYVGREWRQGALAPDLQARLLAPLEGLHPDVRSLSKEVCLGRDSARAKIDAVTTFLRTKFRYASEGVHVPRGAEPLSYFLLQRPAAHCEYFASAAVALLRYQGVPCRYVTGYTVTELESEYGDYWIARNRNAHAWVEAYDDARERWVLVEATPGMNLPSEDDFFASRSEVAAPGQAGELSDAAVSRSWFAFHWLGIERSNLAIVSASSLSLGCLGVLSLLVVRKIRLQRQVRYGNSPELTRLRRQLAQLDRSLRRRRLIRQPYETLHQFADRVRHVAEGDEFLQHAARWYISYALYRYADEPWTSTEAVGPPPVPCA